VYAPREHPIEEGLVQVLIYQLVLFRAKMVYFQSMLKSFGSQNVVIVLAVRDLNTDAIVAQEV
jgi:hypothetical protein